MATTYLTRTPSSAGNRTKWTWSAWIKISIPDGSTNATSEIFYAHDSSSYYFGIRKTATGLRIVQYNDGGTDFDVRTSALLKDVNAWSHLTVTYDSAQSTAADRIKIYINGVLQTSFTNATYPSQNFESDVNRTTVHAIGRRNHNSDNYFVGSMSHIHFCDGYAYSASDFGSTDSTTGEWKINTSPSVSYGTNGFFILKNGNSVTDQSGQSNNWAVSGGTLTKTEDCPSNVFATWGSTYWVAATFANGNTSITTQGSSNYAFNASTLAFNKGKFYWENKITSTSTDMFGISGRYEAGGTQNELGHHADQYGFNTEDGTIRNNNSNSSFGSACNTNGNIIQIAVDCDNLKMYVGVNGTWQNSGVPTSGSTGTGAYSIGALSTTTDGFYFPAIGDWSSGAGSYQTNFGNGYFGTTAVSSAGTNASGNGIFEYDVPTGYTALSTKGLNL